MIVIDNEIGEKGYNLSSVIFCNRLSRILVNNGFGDIKVKLGDVEIACVKNILMNGNATIKKLLEDEEMGEVLELYEKCEVNSFLEIEKYYSGGTMELNENNVCNILRFSVYYNDSRIMRICRMYLKNHMNDSIMMELFSMLKELNINKLNDLRDASESYIIRKSYKYLNEDNLLLKMNLDCLKFILSNPRLVIKDENWLLNRLMRWYKNVLKESSYEGKEEDLNDFINLIKTKIHLNEIEVDEIEIENKDELKDLKIELNECHFDYICIKIEELSNTDLIEIIQELYTEIEDGNDKTIILTDNQINTLSKKEVKEDLIKLLSNDNIKVIEMALNIIMEMKMSEIIPDKIKNKLLLKLLYEYNKCKNKLVLKLLFLFIDNKRDIDTIEYLCGKEVLYRMLCEESYLTTKSKELLVKSIQMKFIEEDVEEMSKIILDEELLEDLKTKEITFISYPHSQYSFGINEEISVSPFCDGSRCEFSINPSLPSGILIDKESGIIHGKVDKITEQKEYEITCKNRLSEKKFKLLFRFVDVKFTELNKSERLLVSDNGKFVNNKNSITGYYYHCYLDLKIERGIYHIKYQFHQNGSTCDYLFIGLSTDNTYSGKNIFGQLRTCNYFAWGGKSLDISFYCHIGRVVDKNPNFNNHGDGSIYEIIVDMNKREFLISHNNSYPTLLVKDLPSPLYPYVCLYDEKASIELISYLQNNF